MLTALSNFTKMLSVGIQLQVSHSTVKRYMYARTDISLAKLKF